MSAIIDPSLDEQALAARVPTGAPGPLLVASDGTEGSASTLTAARLIAEKLSADVRVLAVVDSVPLIASTMDLPVWHRALAAELRSDITRRVRAQLEAADTGAEHWPLDVREGTVALTIAGAARDLGAQLVIVGLGGRGFVDRLFGDETPLRVLRLADAPLLAVPRTFRALPSRVVIATDFSAASVRAARAALHVVREDAMLHLVHVVPQHATIPGTWEALQLDYRDEVPAAFRTVRALLGAPATMRIEAVTLSGSPARELLEFAKMVNADLIVAGTHGRGALSRLMVGSVATHLLRHASCALFVVSPAARTARPRVEREAPRATGSTPDRAGWPALLEQVTRRNVTRDCSIEVDDPELGAQAQVLDYPFLGAAWDPRDARVDIMLGEMGSERRHFTRSIGGVTGIDRVTDERGSDLVLRIAHGRGQTLLTFR